jgi:hypothetical protein
LEDGFGLRILSKEIVGDLGKKNMQDGTPIAPLLDYLESFPDLGHYAG